MPSLVKRLLAAVLSCVAFAGVPATHASASSLPDEAARTGTPSTRLVYLVPRCEDCTLYLYGYDSEGGGWGTPPIEVNDGRAEVSIGTAETRGLVALVVPPWEPDAGSPMTGTPTIVMRYNKQSVGSDVSLERARTRTRGTGCWAGTDARRHRFHVVVRKVRSGGQVSTIAFVRTTEEWTRPMTSAPGGRLRTFSATPCVGAS